MSDWFKNLLDQIQILISTYLQDHSTGTNNPSRPKDWKLTMDDLMKEMKDGKRKTIGQPEIDWAREYQVSLIPKNYRSPQKGDVYESVIDQEVDFLTSWSAPYTGGGKGLIYKGEKIWINDKTSPKSPGTYAQAFDYEVLERRMVSEKDLSSYKYDGFYFHFSTIDLNEKFKLIQTNYKKD